MDGDENPRTDPGEQGVTTSRVIDQQNAFEPRPEDHERGQGTIHRRPEPVERACQPAVEIQRGQANQKETQSW